MATSIDINGDEIQLIHKADNATNGSARPFDAIPQKFARAFEIKKAMMKLHSAAMDAARDGDQETAEKIAEILNKARREIYSILAES